MTSSASESAFEQTTYDAVISKTFTRITECPPTRRSVDTLRKEVEHVLVNISVPNFGWSEKYGLLAEIKPGAEYTTITGGLVYVAVDDEEPSLTHPRIRRTNSKYRKKKRTTAWSAYRTSWYTRKGGMDAVSFNIRQALPAAYYEQLKDTLFGYKEVSPRDYFDHLDDHWCKMNTKTIKSMTKSFYEPWN